MSSSPKATTAVSPPSRTIFRRRSFTSSSLTRPMSEQPRTSVASVVSASRPIAIGRGSWALAGAASPSPTSMSSDALFTALLPRASRHVGPAVGVDHLARDEDGLVGSQEDGDARDLVRLGHAAHGNLPRALEELFLGVAVTRLGGVGGAGRDRVDAHVVRRQRQRHRPREADHAGLARRVVHAAQIAGHALGGGPVVQVVHADVGALAGHREGQRAADALLGAGDEHGLAGQPRAHRRASRIARHTRSGVTGMSRWRMPSGASASFTALSRAASAPTVPASPTPLAPSGFTVVGTSNESTSKAGRSSARGIA